MRRIQVYWISVIRDARTLYVDAVAGRNPDGTRWELCASAAMLAMQEGRYSFYIIRKGAVYDVLIAGQDGNRYLKSGANGLLLSLPRFQPVPSDAQSDRARAGSADDQQHPYPRATDDQLTIANTDMATHEDEKVEVDQIANAQPPGR